MELNNNTEVTIDTVTPELKIGEIQLSADRRSSKETPLSDAERIRRVVIPANYWGELSASANGTANSGLRDILINGLRAIGSARLKDVLTENPLQRTVKLSDYSVTNLLAWSEETAASRGSLTFDREQVEAWFPSTHLHQQMKEKGEQYITFMSNRLAALAAKNHGLKKPEEADKLITLLASDTENGICSDLIQRLAHISKSLAARTNDSAISLDDL